MKSIQNTTKEIKEGMFVRITRKASNDEEGWMAGWVSPNMDREVGKIFRVSGLGAHHNVFLKGSGYVYPDFILEIVELKSPGVTLNGRPRIRRGGDHE